MLPKSDFQQYMSMYVYVYVLVYVSGVDASCVDCGILRKGFSYFPFSNILNNLLKLLKKLLAIFTFKIQNNNYNNKRLLQL